MCKGLSPDKRSRAESPEDSGDEAVATDEATPARKRKSEGDRIQFFKNDPLCKELEPLRALCANCNTWVDLHQKRKYVMKEWVVHQKSCKRGSVAPTLVSTEIRDISVDLFLHRSPSTRVTPARPPVSREQSVQLKDEDSESPARKVKLRRFTEVERKSILDNDPRSGEVRPQEVFCIPCNKFIRLSTKTSYALYNWEAHSSKCFKTQ